jgi:hypothetical protein
VVRIGTTLFTGTGRYMLHAASRLPVPRALRGGPYHAVEQLSSRYWLAGRGGAGRGQASEIVRMSTKRCRHLHCGLRRWTRGAVWHYTGPSAASPAATKFVKVSKFRTRDRVGLHLMKPRLRVKRSIRLKTGIDRQHLERIPMK